MKDLDEKGQPEAPRKLFERAVQRIDHGAANRLRLARRTALAGGTAPSRRAWLPALATAALLLLGLAWWLPQRTSTPTTIPTASSTATPDVSDLAVEGEDAELYAWLGEAPVAADAEPEQKL